MGVSIIEFDNGEGKVAQGYDFTGTAGVGAVYEIVERTFYAGAWCDYVILAEGSTTMSSIMFSLGLNYRF